MDEIIYNIISYLIILIALFIAGRKLFQKMFVKKESSCADGCGGCSTKCDLKELVNAPKVNQ